MKLTDGQLDAKCYEVFADKKWEWVIVKLRGEKGEWVVISSDPSSTNTWVYLVWYDRNDKPFFVPIEEFTRSYIILWHPPMLNDIVSYFFWTKIVSDILKMITKEESTKCITERWRDIKIYLLSNTNE